MKSNTLRVLILITLLTGLMVAGCHKPTDPDQVSKPVFSPAGGTYEGVVDVGLTTTTPGTTIRYTTDGSDPNTNSSVYYSPIHVTQATTLKAIAYGSGLQDSAIATASYTITLEPSEMLFVHGGSFNPAFSYTVTLSSFYLGKYEVTQAEYQAVMGTNPSISGGNPNRPVEMVSWFKAIEYCNRRSIMEDLSPCYSYLTYGTNPDNWPSGWNIDSYNATNITCAWSANGYRLPTEMEWMFAAKGGNQSQGYTYSGSNYSYDVAWYFGNSGGRTHDVGEKAANELGTFDMSGNVWEWCWDIYGDYPTGSYIDPTGPDGGSSRVKRGGSWGNSADGCTVRSRDYGGADGGSSTNGFRVCMAMN